MKHPIKYAPIGSISHGTLKTEDLLESFIFELEWQQNVNGNYLIDPANSSLREAIANAIGEAQDCFDEDGEAMDGSKLDNADELVNETMPVLLNQIVTPYCYFGTHPGDGSDFGFWPCDIEGIKEQVEFSSSVDQEYPADDFVGEWLHINERGNCTLYVRENGEDSEVWSIV